MFITVDGKKTELSEGTSISELRETQTSDFMYALVNGRHEESDYVLSDGDTIHIVKKGCSDEETSEHSLIQRYSVEKFEKISNKRFPNHVTIPRSGFVLTGAPAGILHGYDVGNQPQICQDLTVLHSESHQVPFAVYAYFLRPLQHGHALPVTEIVQ